MIRMIQGGLHAVYRMVTHLAQATMICLQLAYVLLTLLGGFIAQLTVMAQVAAWCHLTDLMPKPESLLIGLPMESRSGAWRLLGFFGAFIWLGYILPARQHKGRKSWRKRQGHPYWSAGHHAWLWGLLWGPLGLQLGLYKDVATSIIAVIAVGLIATYYIYVWQGLIVPRLHTWANRERRAWQHLTTARVSR